MIMYLCWASTKKSINILPLVWGKSPSVGGFLQAQEWVLFSCDICGGMKGMLAQSPESSCNLPTLPRQHTPQAKKTGDEMLLPSAIRERQLLTACSDSTAKREQEGRILLPSKQLYTLLLLCHSPQLSPNQTLWQLFTLPCIFTECLGQREEKKGNAWTEETGKYYRGDSKENNLKEKEPEKRQEIIHLVMHSSHALYVPLETC